MKSFFSTVMLFGSSIAFQYLPYRQIRPLFLDMYHVMHPKNVSLEHIVPQSLFKSRAPEMSRDMHNLMLYPVLFNSLLFYTWRSPRHATLYRMRCTG